MPTPVTPSKITALMTGFRKEFQNGLAMAPSHYQQVATSVPSTYLRLAGAVSRVP